MANKKKHIDDLFKDGLQGSQLPLDGSEWDRLAGALHPGKKKRFAWWWFAGALVLLSSVGLLIYNLSSSSDATLSEDLPALEERREINTERRENREEKIENRIETEDESKVESEVESNLSERSLGQNNANTDASSGDNTTSSKRSSATKTVQSQTTKSGTNIPSKIGSIDNNKTGQATNTTSKPSRNIELLRLAAKSGVVLVINNPFDFTLLSVEEKLGETPPYYIYPMESLIDTFKPITQFIDPYIGFGIGGSRLSQQLNSSITNYTTYRNGNESASFRPNLGLDIGAGYKGLELASGLRYQEKGQENNPVFRYEIYDSVLRVDANGDTSYPRYNYRDTLVSGVTSPRYRYVTIPLSIGKTIYAGNKFDLALGINTNVQYLIGGTGTILNADLNLQSVQRLSSFNRLSLTYGGYIASSYAINDRMKLRLLVRYDADALDMVKHNDISQKMSGFGTDLSLQFKLKK